MPGAIVGGLIIGVGEKLGEVYWGPLVGGAIENWFAYVLALGFLLGAAARIVRRKDHRARMTSLTRSTREERENAPEAGRGRDPWATTLANTADADVERATVRHNPDNTGRPGARSHALSVRPRAQRSR